MKSIHDHSVLALSGDLMKQLAGEALSPETAFLLSRIDGKADLALISFMANIDLPKCLALLAPLVEKGLLVEVFLATPKDIPKKKVGSILDLLEHEETDPRYAKLPREFRREILLLFSRLGEMSHYEILNLARKDSEKKIKESYFVLSKKFHPDRFFSQDVGHYRKEISKIFERIHLAYQVLFDSKRRKVYDRDLDEAAGKQAAATGDESNPMVANMNRARRYYQWGEEDYQKGNYVSAASNFLLATTFDKESEEYARAYQRVKPFVERKKAKDLQARALAKEEAGDSLGAFKIFQELESVSPAVTKQDPDIIMKMARLALTADLDVEQVAEYNRKAKEVLGETAGGLFITGVILEKKGNLKAALAMYRQAQTLDPEDADVARAIKRLSKKKV